MMTLTPAKLIGYDRTKGSISPGKDADLIAFDDAIAVSTVMVGGRLLK